MPLFLISTARCQQPEKLKTGKVTTNEKSDFQDFRPILTGAPPPKFFHGPKFPKQNCTVLVIFKFIAAPATVVEWFKWSGDRAA